MGRYAANLFRKEESDDESELAGYEGGFGDG